MTDAAASPTALDRHLVASLASVRSDGRPHVVPLWFVWDGSAFVMYSKPHAVKVQNLRRDPNAMLALGEPGRLDGSAALVEVRAEIEEAVGLLTAFADKYAELMGRLGLSRETFASVYSQPIRLVPIRWLAWGGSGGGEMRRPRRIVAAGPARRATGCYRGPPSSGSEASAFGAPTAHN
jgi:PPOX class probable F420-dependent enzyme